MVLILQDRIVIAYVILLIYSMYVEYRYKKLKSDLRREKRIVFNEHYEKEFLDKIANTKII